MFDNILDKIDLRQLGERLQKARKRQGLTQDDAAKVIDVARTTVTAIEKGERRVKASELLKLAEAYGREISEFVASRPQIGDFQVQFRSALSRTWEDDKHIVASIELLEELCTNYLALEQLVHNPMLQHYPPVFRYDNRRTEQAAEGLAIAERNRLGLGDGPMPVLRDILENNVGLRIFYLPLEPSNKFSEIYTFEPNLGGCMALNALHPVERCRWSMAHAYAHFLAHRTKPTVSVYDEGSRKPESERFADDFAKFFLLPTSSITQRINALYQANSRVTPADLVKLANYYGVSVEAMMRRLEEMKLAPSGLWDRLQARGFKVQEAQRLLGLQPIGESQNQFPDRYIKLAIAAYEAGEISDGELARYLHTDLVSARAIVEEYGVDFTDTKAFDQDIMELVTS